MIRAAALAVGILVVVIPSDGRAFLYQPDDRTGVVPVNEQGKPTPLPFDEFSRRRLILRNVTNPDWPLEAINPQTKQPVIDPQTGHPRLSERGVVKQRIDAARKKPNRTQLENVALAVDLLRFGRPDEAAGVLANERSGYLPNVTLAFVAVSQDSRDHPGWPRAFNYLDIASEERPPASLPGMSPQQLAWELKLDRGALLKFIKLRWEESKGAKGPPEDELPDAIWPVKFVNDAGQYEPGKLAAAEKAKLPGGDFTEAIATVQQLVLWFPLDIRLYWLLGELYAAKGDFHAAKRVMDECVNTGHYSNRKALMHHREAVTKAAAAAGEAAPPELASGVPTPEPTPQTEEKTEQPVPFSLGMVWVYFGAVAVIALFALLRAVTKKKGTSGRGRPS